LFEFLVNQEAKVHSFIPQRRSTYQLLWVKYQMAMKGYYNIHGQPIEVIILYLNEKEIAFVCVKPEEG